MGATLLALLKSAAGWVVSKLFGSGSSTSDAPLIQKEAELKGNDDAQIKQSTNVADSVAVSEQVRDSVSDTSPSVARDELRQWDRPAEDTGSPAAKPGKS